MARHSKRRYEEGLETDVRWVGILTDCRSIRMTGGALAALHHGPHVGCHRHSVPVFRREARFDPRYKTLVWDLGQNVDRQSRAKFGLTGC